MLKITEFVCVQLSLQEITTYASTKDAANALTIELKKTNPKQAYYAIVKACTPKGSSKTAYGYQWRYISNDGGIVKRDCD